LCVGGDFVETHGYIWHSDDWMETIGFDPGPCITLKNPAAENCARLRNSLVPGLLAFAERNRHHFDRFQLAEIGTVFETDRKSVEQSQHRRLGLLVAEQGKKADPLVWDRMRLTLHGWARQIFERSIEYRESKSQRPWEDADRLAEVVMNGQSIGRATIVPLALRQKIDERLKSWSFAVAELDLSAMVDWLGHHEKLTTVPRHPQVELDFSVLANSGSPYTETSRALAAFKHPLLRRLTFLYAYEGGSIPDGKRSLTLRTRIGRDDRTLTDGELQEFREAFKAMLTTHDLELRG